MASKMPSNLLPWRGQRTLMFRRDHRCEYKSTLLLTAPRRRRRSAAATWHAPQLQATRSRGGTWQLQLALVEPLEPPLVEGLLGLQLSSLRFLHLFLLPENQDIHVRQDVGVHEQPETRRDGEERGGRHPSRPHLRLRLPHGVHHHRVRHSAELQPHPDRRPDRFQSLRSGNADGYVCECSPADECWEEQEHTWTQLGLQRTTTKHGNQCWVKERWVNQCWVDQCWVKAF